jgi:hypothetical protein
MEFIVDPYFYASQWGEEVMKEVFNAMWMSDDEKFMSTVLDTKPSPFMTMDMDDLSEYAVEVLKWLN